MTIPTPMVSIHAKVPSVRAVPAAGPIIVCPCLAGFPAATALRTAILPVHDANAWLDAPKAPAIPPALRERLYFGVFALDRLRSRERILTRLAAQGIPGVINLPTVACFDGQAGLTLASLGFGTEEELEFLLAARQAGLRAGFCTRPGDHPPPHAFAMIDFVAWQDVATGSVTLAG
ncbi:phosphoenolpyruvate hydrolase family protein [Alsobacter sp. R-9]